MNISTLLLAALMPGLALAQDKTTEKVQEKPQDKPVRIDPAIAPYAKVTGISGNVNSIGSDTLNNLMTLWAEGFQKVYPGVKIQIEGKGSNTAPPALIAGTAQLGPMSREMKGAEIEEFEKKFGYKPTAIRVAVDALAVWVHKDNPIEKLTLPEIDAMFSKGRKGGYEKELTAWGQLGLAGDWSTKAIRLYGRNSASGTYGYFKDHALFKGDFKDSVKEQPGSAAVVQSITEDLAGIGYSGIGYRTSGVKPLMIAEKAGAPYSGVDEESVYSGKYKLARFLYVYVNKAPDRAIDPLVGEFLRFVISAEGQQIVVKDGYLPLKPKMIEKELEKLGASTGKAPSNAGAKKG